MRLITGIVRNLEIGGRDQTRPVRKPIGLQFPKVFKGFREPGIHTRATSFIGDIMKTLKVKRYSIKLTVDELNLLLCTITGLSVHKVIVEQLVAQEGRK